MPFDQILDDAMEIQSRQNLQSSGEPTLTLEQAMDDQLTAQEQDMLDDEQAGNLEEDLGIQRSR